MFSHHIDVEQWESEMHRIERQGGTYWVMEYFFSEYEDDSGYRFIYNDKGIPIEFDNLADAVAFVEEREEY